MNWKKYSLMGSAITLLLVAALATYVAYTTTLRVYAQEPVETTPFQLEQVTVSYAKDPAGKVLERRTVGRRADGSRAMLGVFPSQPDVKPIRRVDFADGRSSMIVDELRAKMSGFLPNRAVVAYKRELRVQPEGCAYPTETVTGKGKIAGLDVWEVTREFVSGRRVTQWRAPQLQCYPLQSKHEVKNGTKFEINIEITTSFVRLGEPDPAMFNVESAREMVPSDLRRLVYKSIGVSEAACPECFGPDSAKLDKLYYERQQPTP